MRQENWNNLQDRHVCPPKCALTCKRLFWFTVRVVLLSVLVALPMAHALQMLWRSFLSLPPSLPWPCHMSPVPVLPSLFASLPLVYVSVHSCFLPFHFGPGTACLPHLTTRLIAQKVMMNHIPPTRCLKTKINTNANFHTPNHAVQHRAGFTSSSQNFS